MPDIFVPEDTSQEEPTRYGRTAPEKNSGDSPKQQAEESLVFQTPEKITTSEPMPTQTKHDESPITPSTTDIPADIPPHTHEVPIHTQGGEFTYPAPSNYHLIQETHTTGIPLFTSFWQNPQGVYFDTQGAHEPIFLFLRRHFITNIPWVTSIIFFLFVPFILGYLIQISRLDLSFFSLFSVSHIRLGIAFYMLLVLTYAFIKFIGWYYNISLITPERILDIELEDLVSKKIAETKISLVQDVQNVQSGALRSIVDYGNVLVQTAGTQDNFLLHSVPKPELVIKIVGELIGKERGGAAV